MYNPSPEIAKVGWNDWATWAALFDHWKKWMTAEERRKTPLMLRRLYAWYLRECERLGLDPYDAIEDLGSYISWKETYKENLKILASLLPKKPTAEEREAMYEGFLADAEEIVKREYPGLLEKWQKRVEELEKETEHLPKIERDRQRWKKLAERLQYELDETIRRHKQEKRALEEKVAPIRLRVLKDFVHGIDRFRVGTVFETRDIEWAFELIGNELVERVPPEVPVKVPPPPKELTKEELRRLEDEFRVALMDQLGRIPRDSMAKFRLEIEKVKFKPYKEALDAIRGLATEIVWMVTKKPPVVRPPVVRPPPVPKVVEVPEEWVVEPVKLPEEPICKELPFPRAPCSEERKILWDHFKYEMARIGVDFTKYIEAYKERTRMPFRSWDALIKTYREFIKDIEAGKPLALIPLIRVPMPWREDTEEHWRFDAIVHLTSLRLYKTIDNLIYSREPPGLEAYGVRDVTPEEVKEAVKKAWREKNVWFATMPKEFLESFIEEKIE